MAEIAIGTAGWSYRDWEGIVYPRSERDKLRFLARYVDRIEIDTTFYRIPAPETVRSWHARTADFPGFRFTAKLHQIFTHGPGFGPADIRAFHAAMEPLSANGRLSHLLAQFRWDFVDDAAARRRLVNVVDDAALSTFQVPAVIERAPLQLAISSGGAAPMLARRLRERLETELDPALGALAGLFAAQYLIQPEQDADVLLASVPDFLKHETIPYLRRTKSGERMDDLRPMVYDLIPRENGLLAALALREQGTAKPEALIQALAAFAGATVPPCLITRLQLLDERFSPLEDA